MSWPESLKKAATVLETVTSGLTDLQKLTHVGGDNAANALIAIDAGLSVLIKGMTGELTADQVRAQIAGFTATLASNDSTIKAEIDREFDGSDK